MLQKIIEISINENETPHSIFTKWSLGKWTDLYKVTKKFEYSSINFTNGKRDEKSAKGISSIILDFDENFSLAEAISTFSKYISLIVTTKSHQKDKHGLICDRFRVILPLPYSIINIEYYKKLMYEIVRFYNSDKACTDAARYYSPNENQEVYYSKSINYFELSRFEKIFEEKKISVLSSDNQQKPNKLITTNDELVSLFNQKVIYYINGNKTVNTLDEIISNRFNRIKLKCHCFINSSHEDINPSCAIYINETNIYIKCFACNIKKIIIKGLQ